MKTALGQVLIADGVGCFVNQHVRRARQLHSALAVDGVRAIDEGAPLFRRAAELLPVEGATVRQSDLLSALEPAVNRAGRNAKRARLLHVKRARALRFRDAIAEGGNAMLQAAAGDYVILVLVDQPLFDRMNR